MASISPEESSMVADKDFTFVNVPSSKLVTFIVGLRYIRCRVHSDALLQRFPQFELHPRHLDGDLQLTFRGNESEFDALFQYIYTGTYDSPEPVLVAPPDVASGQDSKPPKPIPGLNSDEDGNPTTTEYRKLHERHRDLLVESFKVELARLKNRVAVAAHYSRPNINPLESYENIFKRHVDIYLVSHLKYPALAELAIYKLYRSLVDFQLHDERAIDIVKLLKYLYAPKKISFRNDIAKIFVHYAAIHVDKLWKNDDFIKFLRSNVDFAVDLMDILINHRLPKIRPM